MSQWCYSVTGDVSDPAALKKYVETLYVKYQGEGIKIPVVATYSRLRSTVCIKLLSTKKEYPARITAIHSSLKLRDLTFRGVKLGRPVLFVPEKCIWWNDSSGCGSDQTKKWDTLRHNGPYFTHLYDPYTPHHVPLIYAGKKVALNAQEEKVATLYAQRIYSETEGTGVRIKMIGNKDFDRNFFTDFKKYLTPEHKELIQEFSNLNFSLIVKYLKDKKAQGDTPEEKLAKKIKNEEKKQDFGFAIVNGVEERVGNFTVEPMGIFYGRGDKKTKGKIKPDIQPEEVTINIDRTAPIPALPPGRRWKEVVHDNSVEWIAKWTEHIDNQPKYTRLAPEGQMKGKNDYVKYEKARKLNNFIDLVRERYTLDLSSPNARTRQLSTVLYFIDNHGIRVGTEKAKDEGDTVGASTLLVSNINLKTKGKVVFDFLGKDSVQFYKEIAVPLQVYANLVEFSKGKPGGELLFNMISAPDITSYLKSFDKSFSSKVFRTRLASNLMYHELVKTRVTKNTTAIEKKKIVDDANIKVANLLNHRRTVPLTAQKQITALQEKLKANEKKRRLLIKEGKSTTAVEKAIAKQKIQIEHKSNTTDIAITTSRTNYIDPRIIVAWSKKAQLVPPWSLVYSKALQDKFQWAIDMIPPSWDYLSTPLRDDLADLAPVEEEPREKGKKNSSKKPDKRSKPSAKKPKRSVEKKVGQPKPDLTKRSGQRIPPVLTPEGSTEYLVEVYVVPYGPTLMVYGTGAKLMAKELEERGGVYSDVVHTSTPKAWVFPGEKAKIIKKYLEVQETITYAKVIACARELSTKYNAPADSILEEVREEVPFVGRFLSDEGFAKRVRENYAQAK
jgi:DNA topoisomerase I